MPNDDSKSQSELIILSRRKHEESEMKPGVKRNRREMGIEGKATSRIGVGDD
jgi:hypothetical protein